MRETEFTLNGAWLLIFKALLALGLVLVPLGVGWGVWVTGTLFDLRTGSAVVEARSPAATVRENAVDTRLSRIQMDIAELRVLIVAHITHEKSEPIGK